MTTSPWLGGDQFGLTGFAWFALNSEGKTHAVGKKSPNAFGLFDMLGNVEQLCRAHDRGVVCRGGVAHDILSVRSPAWRPVTEDDVYFRRGFRVAIVGDLKPTTSPPTAVPVAKSPPQTRRHSRTQWVRCGDWPRNGVSLDGDSVARPADAFYDSTALDR